MRIKTICLSWFRGAAEKAALETEAKSLVIYGPNGSGKSSFVDAVEYILEKGKIGHLSHEYSGRKQEKGTLNTHIPDGADANITIKFADDSALTTCINPDGRTSFSGADHVGMPEWDYKRTILRQNEVAAFISARKGDKYSALLPLLHLQALEVAEENLRQLTRTIDQRPTYKSKKAEVANAKLSIESQFGDQPENQIWNLIGGIHKKYLRREHEGKIDANYCITLDKTLTDRIARLSSDERQYYMLLDIKQQAIVRKIQNVREISVDLASETEPFIEERLEILQAAASLADKVEGSTEVTCPACGQSVSIQAFQEHVQSEQTRLRGIIERFNTRRAAVSRLSDAIKAAKETLERAELFPWMSRDDQAEVRDALQTVAVLNVDRLRTTCSEKELRTIEDSFRPIVGRVEAETSEAPPDVQTLSSDKQKVNAAEALLSSREAAAEVEEIEKLVRFVGELERQVRSAIRSRSCAVIKEITADIEAMWAILHPGERIEKVRLYVPEDADKAIDIALKFYGVDQDSPRLTLSEGHRNSLGLCIFLGMAKREGGDDRPLFLDDVVVSLDRNHRGMVAEVLEREFAGRQVIILTHDREWYTELRHQLPHSEWKFNALLPWHDPLVGIRWSSKTNNFDEARTHLEARPDSAGNDARKIMDIELALVAETLHLRMPYLRGERNDYRTANDYIARLIGDAPNCLQKRANGGYGEPVKVWTQTQRLLTSWANRGSHSFDLVRSEAEKLIETCEMALGYFTCQECSTGIWRADDASGKAVQCRCGQIRWRYGKG